MMVKNLQKTYNKIVEQNTERNYES